MVGRNQPIFSPHTGFRLWGFFFGLGGLWADHALRVLSVYPFLRVWPISVPLLQRVTFSNAGMPAQQKVTKRLRPDVRPARWGSGFLRCGIDPGAAAPVCFAAPPSAVYDCVVRSLRSHARINPSAQPADGLQDQEPLELALIVLSGEKRWGLLLLLLFCGSELAREGGLTADRFLTECIRSKL